MLADDEEIEQGAEEGIRLYAGYSNTGFRRDESGRVTGLDCYAISDFRFTSEGLYVERIADTDLFIPCDVVVYASGQKTDLSEICGIKLNPFGFPIDPATGKSGLKTSVDGIFTAGDVVTGTKSVIHAIAGGREAAAAIDLYLGGNGDIEETLVEVPPPDPYLGPMEDFAGLPRQNPDITPSVERRSSFLCVDNNFSEAAAKAEAVRCLKCPLRLQIDQTMLWTQYEGEKHEENL